VVIISDGAPNDFVKDDNPQVTENQLKLWIKESEETAIGLAKLLQRSGAVVISSYFAERDSTTETTFFTKENEQWDQGAKIMFRCASYVPMAAVTVDIKDIMDEDNWVFEDEDAIGFAAFTQVNHSKHFKNFINLKTLSALARRKLENEKEEDEKKNTNVKKNFLKLILSPYLR